MFYLVSFTVALALSIALTPLAKKFAFYYKILDHPNQARKIHQQPTALLGGLAVYLAFSLTTLGFLISGNLLDGRTTTWQIGAILIGGLILMLGGILDDKYRIKPWQQILFPLFAASLVIASGVKVQFVTNPLGGVIVFPVALGTVVAFLWLVGMMYTTKFLDGLDGLLSGITTIGALIIFGVSLFWDVPMSTTSILALILTGSTLGFLFFNWHPAKIFLGEGGSVFCGFMLGVLAIISGSKIATALLIMGIPILDVAWVIIRRFLQGNSPTQGDRKHLHFRLLDIGLSHRQTVVVLYLITTTFGLSSIYLPSFGKVIALVILIIFMIILAGGLVYIFQRKNEDT